MTTSDNVVTKRLFVGGLSSNVTSTEIEERFSKFGMITELSFKIRRDESGDPVKSFAHLNIEGDEAHIKKCFAAFQNTKWKGSTLKLQYAKESFISRLEKERESQVLTSNQVDVEASKRPDRTSVWRPPVFQEIKGAPVPGTPVPGKKDWIVGKYGRILPVMKLKKSSSVKIVKHDPSKLCHAAKIFKDDKQVETEEATCKSLTWNIDTPDSEITKKRKGQLPPTIKSASQRKHITKMTDIVRASSPNRPVNGKPGVGKLTVDHTDFEVVSFEQGTRAHLTHATEKSNKFDSDVESDAGDNAIGKPQSNSNKSTNVVKHEKETMKLSVQSFDMDENISSKRQFSNSKNNKKKRNSMNTSSIEGDSKIPEFHGLSMLGLGVSEVKAENGKPTNVEHSRHASVRNASSPDGLTNSVQSPSDNGHGGKDAGNRTLKRKHDGRCGEYEPSPALRRTETSELPANVTAQPASSPAKTCSALAVKTNCSLKGVLHKSEDGFDSASSADTDEIIARKKKKTYFASFTEQKDEKSKGGLDKSQSKSEIILRKDRENLSIDKDLSLSEFDAGTSDIIEGDCFQPYLAKSANTSYDYYDSDLDDNDFEFAAKKIAKKAGLLTMKDGKKKRAAVKNKLTGDQSGTSSTPIEVESEKALISIGHSSTGKQKDKKTADNEKRLRAVKGQMKIKQQQQALMQKALMNVDAKDSKKRIVFSSDEEAGDSKSKSECTVGDAATARTHKKSGMQLFDDSAENDGEESDYEEMFSSKPQFEGKKGDKLMKLERRIGDSRFKLDAKFMDSDSEKEEVEEKTEDESSDLLKDERVASLKILENVIGKSTLDQFTAKMKRNTKHIIDMNTVRFDPTKITTSPLTSELSKQRKAVENDNNFNKKLADPAKPTTPQHNDESTNNQRDSKSKSQKMEFQAVGHKKKQDQDSGDCEQTKAEKKKIKKGEKKHEVQQAKKSKVELSTSLVNLFKVTDESEENNGQQFSLTSQFGECTDETVGNTAESQPLSGLLVSKDENQSNTLSELRNVTEDDVSSEDDEEEDISNDDNARTDIKNYSDESNSNVEDDSAANEKIDYDEERSMEEGSNNEDIASEQSFLTDEKPCADTELLSAGRVDVRHTKDKWLEKWQELRSTIVKLYKKKHKDAVKSKRMHSEAKRRKEFLQNSKKSHRFRPKK